nr:MAG TPA: hypothetical protein [Caudoviricetes sp.]
MQINLEVSLENTIPCISVIGTTKTNHKKIVNAIRLQV